MKLIGKRSQFDRKQIQKEIGEYERIKKTLYNNKKVLNLNRLKTFHVDLGKSKKQTGMTVRGEDKASKVFSRTMMGSGSEAGLEGVVAGV
ncbi:MAG: hypothetical protein KDD45_12500 [Bdellovibrionales bacterium]|nr:hypothetical protein [Bdellovibrionales bacterium]